MKFATVTLGYEDVEWIGPFDELKSVLLSDRMFGEWKARLGLMEALEVVYRLHRELGNQLVREGVMGHAVDDWSDRTLHLIKRVSRRRYQLRKMVRAEYGSDHLHRWVAGFDTRFDR